MVTVPVGRVLAAGAAITGSLLCASTAVAAPTTAPVVVPSAAAAPATLIQAAQPIAWPVVRGGSTGQPVRSLQYLLRARGYAVRVDGAFGSQTDAAVRAFQRARGLPVDGVVGRATWGAVLVTVRYGSTGDAVRAVQDQFRYRNLSGDPSQGLQVDGIFGPATLRTVKAFQSAVRLSADGIVGPATWNQLFGGALSG